VRFNRMLSKIFIVMGLAITSASAVASGQAGVFIRLKDDQSVVLRFSGSPTADLFTRELDESFQGVLEQNFVSTTSAGFPAGFVNASLPGFPWAGTMWTRDGGTFMRELVMRGYYQHASLLAECLMALVKKNDQGFFTFPRYFKGYQAEPGPPTELDGTASIVIAMGLLWERLPDGNPTKNHIRDFLFQDASPLNYFKFELKAHPLIAGSGEFGCGGGHIKELCDNVVQNDLVMLALLATAEMAQESGNEALAQGYRRLAERIRSGMDKYLVNKDGSWIWCVDPITMKPDPAILNSPANRGTGSLNGVAAMYADVLGLTPLSSSWPGVEHSERTFEQLYNTPLRKKEFDHYGIWTQSDVVGGGLLASPSYGQGYAIQTMLLFDKLEMAEKALGWLADATYDPVPEYKLHRASLYYFYERMYSPDAVGKVPLEEGCGALNLVNVSEPLKVSRLMLGVDDSSLQYVRLIPRIPGSWKGVEARNWPIRTRRGIVRADIQFERKGTGGELTLSLMSGQTIDEFRVRMPAKNGYVWREQKNVRVAHFITQ
jgi:hypothetical protein